MANEINKFGCSTGRVSLVDPNKFDGQNSSSNISVPLEDLSIYVQLETTKRARTLLTSEGKSNTSDSSKEVKITFIEGSEYGTKKSLTTNFTDLTTSFDNNSNGESLGITSIDIDFNSSYAPLVTINFVDLRGSAIFQNEHYIINGNKNKYATFFQLPYPLYILTIKGYYGMPVKYELHMTKFSAKFNSQTGNFEITASFIGYTYAMLSDMLLGFLRAIPYTTIGKIEYDKLKVKQPELITLDELIKAVDSINSSGQKLKADDEEVAQLNLGKDKLLKLDEIKSIIINFGVEVDFKAGDINQSYDDAFKFVITANNISTTSIQTSFDNYKKNIIEAISGYNETNEIKLNESNFTNDVRPEIKNISRKKLRGSNDELRDIFGSPILTYKQVEATKDSLVKYIDFNNYNFSDNFEFNVRDFRKQFRIIEETRTKLINLNKENEKKVGDKLRLLLKSELGFDPTVRNIVSIYTAAVEAFVNTLYNVSATALSTEKDTRDNQLKKYVNSFSESYDIKKTKDPIYYPWPEYREVSSQNGLTEKYLGEPGVLTIPTDVTEIKFINDLLLAFLISKKEAESSLLELTNDTTNWVAINPLDTRLFINEFPYKRINCNNKKDIINLLITRAFIYLGMTNYSVTEEEIKNIALLEADLIMNSVTNANISSSLTQLSLDDFYNSNGINGETESGDNEVKMMKKDKHYDEFSTVDTKEEEFYYNFIYGTKNKDVVKVNETTTKINLVQSVIPTNLSLDLGLNPVFDPNLALFNTQNTSSTTSDNNTNVNKKSIPQLEPSEFKILPINNSDSETWKFNFGEKSIKNAKEKANDGTLFLTNYSTSNGGFDKKPLDGGIYVKMFTYNEFEEQIKTLPVPLEPTPIILEAIKNEQTTFNETAYKQAGFSTGVYGVQDYGLLNQNGVIMPYRCLFYNSGSEGHKTNIGIKRTGKTIYDISMKDGDDFLGVRSNGSFYNIVGIDTGDYTNFLKIKAGNDSRNGFIGGYGANRVRLSDMIINGSDNYTVPYVSFKMGDNVDVGLFTSLLYYSQKDTKTSTADMARAYLFLHTLPFNGLMNDRWDALPENYGVFSKNEILNTFGNRAGFISAPKLWVAFIGALLWRRDKNNPIKENGIQIGGGSGIEEPITFRVYDNIETNKAFLNIPSNTEYFSGLDYSKQFEDNIPYSPNLENILRQLPDQAKDEFKRVFYEFVSSDWVSLKSKLEIVTSDGNGESLKKWKGVWESITSTGPNGVTKIVDGNVYLKVEKVKQFFNKKFEDYIVFSPLFENDGDPSDLFKYNYVNELNGDSEGSKMLVNLMSEEIVIANMTYRIWQKKVAELPSSKIRGSRSGVWVKPSDLKIYLNEIITKLKNIQPVADQKKNR